MPLIFKNGHHIKLCILWWLLPLINCNEEWLIEMKRFLSKSLWILTINYFISLPINNIKALHWSSYFISNFVFAVQLQSEIWCAFPSIYVAFVCIMILWIVKVSSLSLKFRFALLEIVCQMWTGSCNFFLFFLNFLLKKFRWFYYVWSRNLDDV